VVPSDDEEVELLSLESWKSVQHSHALDKKAVARGTEIRFVYQWLRPVSATDRSVECNDSNKEDNDKEEKEEDTETLHLPAAE